MELSVLKKLGELWKNLGKKQGLWWSSESVWVFGVGPSQCGSPAAYRAKVKHGVKENVKGRCRWWWWWDLLLNRSNWWTPVPRGVHLPWPLHLFHSVTHVASQKPLDRCQGSEADLGAWAGSCGPPSAAISGGLTWPGRPSRHGQRREPAPSLGQPHVTRSVEDARYIHINFRLLAEIYSFELVSCGSTRHLT